MKFKNEQKTKFPRDSAGRLMVLNIPIVGPDYTIRDVLNLLFKEMKALETINYVYVVNENKKLLGVFSIKEVFRQNQEKKVEEIMKKQVIKVNSHADQERVAILALRNNLKAIPVVDREERLLGIVTSDTILNILHSEHVEDILKAGGSSLVDKKIKELATAPAITLVKARFFWLLIGLLGGVLAAQIIGFFEETLKSQILLALFLPVIVYITDAVATQTETLIIRGIAIDAKFSLSKYFLREIKVGSLLGLILGVISAVIAALWWKEPLFGIILMITLFFSIFLSVIVAMSIPLILQKLKQDPALGSGPFATILTDILSITVYFIIATFLLNFFG